MSIYNRIKVLEQKTESIQLADTPQFYANVEAYQKALKDNKIKEHHICFIDDVFKRGCNILQPLLNTLL